MIMSYFTEYNSFVIYPRESVAVIKINDKIFDLVTDLEESDHLMDVIKKSENDKKIMALLITNEPGCFGEDIYDQFIHEILEQHSHTNKDDLPDFTEKNIRFREINILNKFIREILDYQKLCYAGINGDIVTPFFGTSLAADFRYATENTRFILAHNKFGLHPSGALPFFLSNYLSHSKAIEIQLSHDISAKEAKKLGLINHIFSEENFEDQCLDIINKHLHCSTCTIQRTKQLTNFSRKDLYNYFRFEASLLNL
jgi:enoyl-CoA hydratase/carnithine racemase